MLFSVSKQLNYWKSETAIAIKEVIHTHVCMYLLNKIYMCYQNSKTTSFNT